MRFALRLLAIALVLAGCVDAAPTGDPLVSTEVGVPPGMPTITTSELPPQAIETLELIEVGGPFPYSQDGAVFQNREGLLPDQPEGYYQEYTVLTPGSDDRGARRIVAGAGGERYWTADHYDSFEWIVP